ncbi:G-protein coupled receptor family C group 6 member A-like [Hoplias malabaricus]|uniref:G-protein coupled receptor family C group 6 member A-like n=1 Tax=Hoplias malabaricus TaxID=27720 RepID=UPI0034628484
MARSQRRFQSARLSKIGSWCEMLLRMYLLISGVVVLVDIGNACDYELDRCGAWADGDVQIGILSTFYSQVESQPNRVQPDNYNCTGFSLVSFVRMLALIHTIETINNSSFLPGVRLGYYICDTCSDASKAIQTTEHMLSENGTLSVQCGLIPKPKVKAIIGTRYSELSLSVARLLTLYMVPQISTSSSAEILSDRLRFPGFVRTVPSDVHQTEALAKLMSHFDWNWVGVVHGDDDYGENAFHGFMVDAEAENVCVAFKSTLPHNLNSKDIDMKIQEVADVIQNSRANVVLLILKEELVTKLFTEMRSRNISRTWIASDAWSLSRDIAQMEGMDQIGDIFGFNFITGPNPGFEEYLQELTVPPGTENKFIEEYQQMGYSKDYLTEAVYIDQAYGDRLAVWSIAHALKKLLECNEKACPGELDFPPWKLLQELKNVNFTLDGQTFYFSTSGNFINGYDLINWVQNKSGKRDIVVVGSYSLEQRKINLKKPIEWSNPNNTKPISVCSDDCLPGTAKKLSKTSCCFNCTLCLEGTYSNGTNLQNCFPCEDGTWSLKGWTACKPKNEVFWEWNKVQAIVLLVFIIIGFLLLFINLIIYCLYRQSPVIKQAGGHIYILIMAGLALSFISVILFIGKPTVPICMARQVLYALGFTLTVSCILVKALRTFLAFLPQYRQHSVKKFYKPPAIIFCGTFIQVLICIFWLIFDSPAVETVESNQSMDIIFQCKEGSGVGFAIMLGYIALLALICFVLAFKGRKVPHRFNETGHIILSMLIYLFVWVCFAPIYATKIPERYSIQAAAILVSTYSIIFCHFTPKWYMALCKKKEEVTTEAYMTQACIAKITVNAGHPVFPQLRPVSSKTALITSPSKSTISSIDTTDCTTESPAYFFIQPSVRKRFHRRSI